MSDDFDTTIERLDDAVVRSTIGAPPPIFGKDPLDGHTQTCDSLRRAGIVKLCICPKPTS